MAALVSADDLARPGTGAGPAPRGLLAAVGAWADFEELDEVVQGIYRQRERARDRAVARTKAVAIRREGRMATRCL